jgi:hypothetical protein
MDYIFLNAIELGSVESFQVAPQLRTQQLLERALGVRFDGMVASLPVATMRKQIVPLLQKALEQSV